MRNILSISFWCFTVLFEDFHFQLYLDWDVSSFLSNLEKIFDKSSVILWNSLGLIKRIIPFRIRPWANLIGYSFLHTHFCILDFVVTLIYLTANQSFAKGYRVYIAVYCRIRKWVQTSNFLKKLGSGWAAQRHTPNNYLNYIDLNYIKPQPFGTNVSEMKIMKSLFRKIWKLQKITILSIVRLVCFRKQHTQVTLPTVLLTIVVFVNFFQNLTFINSLQ